MQCGRWGNGARRGAEAPVHEPTGRAIRSRVLPWLAAGVLGLLCLVLPAGAAPILDQDSTGQPAGDLWDDNDSTLYQVFTVGQTGTLDSIQIDLRVMPDTGFQFQVGAVDPAFDPISSPSLVLGTFGSVFVAASTPIGVVLIDLSLLQVEVDPGDRLAFFVEHDDVFSVAGATDYPGGDAFFDCASFDDCIDPLGPPDSVAGGTPIFPVVEAGVGSRQVAFRSFVLVPEPALAGLLLLAALVGRRGRRA